MKSRKIPAFNLEMIALMGFIILIVSPFPVVSQSSTPTLVFIGDSVTADYFADWSHYTDVLAKKPRWQQLNLINSASGGLGVSTFVNTPVFVTQDITEYDPDYLLSYLGLADLFHKNATKFYEDYKWFIDTLLAEIPDLQIFLIRFSWSAHQSEELMESFLEQIDILSSEYGFPVADVYNATKGHPEYFVDGVHPSYAGANIIADVIDNAFVQYLPEITTTTTTAESQTTIETTSLYWLPVLISLGTIKTVRKNILCKKKQY